MPDINTRQSLLGEHKIVVLKLDAIVQAGLPPALVIEALEKGIMFDKDFYGVREREDVYEEFTEAYEPDKIT